MNRTQFLPAAATLAMLAAIGCNSGSGSAGGYVSAKRPPLKSALVQPGQEASYFPFTVGNQWTFDSESTIATNGRVNGTQKKELTYRLVKLSPIDGGQDASFEVMSDGVITSDEVWRMDKKGLYQVSSGPPGKVKVLNPPQTVLPFPVTVGQTFKWAAPVDGEKGEKLNSSINGTVTGQQEIDTEMGPNNALAVDCEGTVKGTNVTAAVTSTIFLIPEVGIGRFVMKTSTDITSPDPKFKGKSIHRESIQIMKLKNFSPKK